MERSRARETHQSTTSVSSTTTNPQLPVEIITDILSRLPVKSLLRFKSVSKSWHNLIQSPTFIKQHFNYSQRNPNPIFSSILSSVHESDKQFLRINLIDALDKPIDLDLPFMSGTRVVPLVVLGITDGLVCLMMQPSHIFICNPLTGDYWKLPPFRRFPEEGMYGNYIYFGFGLNGDQGYELFRMFYRSFDEDEDEDDDDDDDNDNDELVLKGEAYSLATNTWRQINVKRGNIENLEHHHKPRMPNCNYLPVFLRGVFYWETIDPQCESDSEYIVCFDVGSGVFDEFDAPEDCFENVWMLSNLKEEVAVVIYKEDTAFDIWVLDEKNRIWTMKFAMKDGYTLSVFPRNSMVTVLGCTLSGKLVVQDSYKEETKLFLYDMGTKRKPTRISQEKIEILPYANVGTNSSLFLYSESLVSVGAGDDDVAGADIWW